MSVRLAVLLPNLTTAVHNYIVLNCPLHCGHVCFVEIIDEMEEQHQVVIVNYLLYK